VEIAEVWPRHPAHRCIGTSVHRRIGASAHVAQRSRYAARAAKSLQASMLNSSWRHFMPNAFAVVSERSGILLRRGVLRATLLVSLSMSLAAAPLAYGADPTATPDATGTSGAPTTTATATATQPGAATPAPDDTFLLTIFLRHDESKPLPKINDQLRAQGFFKTFPPPGIEVVSWYVMMGIGQVVTLRVPASRLREVNRAIETTAWGGYRTEFYPTYDYKAQAQQMRATDGK
jgi:hypothetical protein